ncbi:MAG: MFS transporter [Acidobacteria bacterium]|nr:MFS transporter [Acidobacteriota bacterium]
MRKLKNLRWYIAALLFTSTVINYIDRQTLSVVKPHLMRDLHLSELDYAHIVQGWLLAYTIMYVVSGFLVDRWGTRKALAAFVSWWSFANVLHVFARTAGSLSFFQVLLGIGEPGNYNAACRAASEWYPPKERAFINGLANAGSALGAIIAMPLVAWLLIHYGWRYAFVATGLLGFIWLIPWLLLYRLPREHTSITDAELDYIHSGPPVLCPEGKPTVKQLLAKPDIWGLMLARFFSDPVWWFYLFWLPGYLQKQRGFTLTQIAIFGWLPYLASDIGGLFGGWLSDRMITWAGSPVRARFIPMAVCAAIMPVSLLIPGTHTMAGLIVVLCIVTFAHMAWKTNLMTITNDVYPMECIGTVFGILMLGSGIGGFLFQGITAHIVEGFSYKGVFIIMGFMHPVAMVVCYWLMRRAKLTDRLKTVIDAT